MFIRPTHVRTSVASLFLHRFIGETLFYVDCFSTIMVRTQLIVHRWQKVIGERFLSLFFISHVSLEFYELLEFYGTQIVLPYRSPSIRASVQFSNGEHTHSTHNGSFVTSLIALHNLLCAQSIRTTIRLHSSQSRNKKKKRERWKQKRNKTTAA